MREEGEDDGLTKAVFKAMSARWRGREEGEHQDGRQGRRGRGPEGQEGANKKGLNSVG